MSTIVNILLKCFVNDRVFLFICLYVSLISVICVAVMYCDINFKKKNLQTFFYKIALVQEMKAYNFLWMTINSVYKHETIYASTTTSVVESVCHVIYGHLGFIVINIGRKEYSRTA